MSYHILENGVGEAFETADGKISYPGCKYYVVRITFDGHDLDSAPTLERMVSCISAKSAKAAIAHYEAIDELFMQDLKDLFDVTKPNTPTTEN